MTPATAASILPYLELLDDQLHPTSAAPVFALAEPGGYDGAPQLTLRSGRYVDVRWCPSELALREALLDDVPAERGLALLTPVRSVGADLAARLVHRKVVQPNRLDALKAAFAAAGVDPLVPEWLAERLLALRPADGYPRSGARLLSAERAWQAYLDRALGLDTGRGLRGLLEWLESRAAARFAEEPEVARDATRARLEASIPGAGGTLAALVANRAEAAVALGLVARTLADAPADDLRAAARVRFEVLLGGWGFEQQAARRWAETAEALVADRYATDAPPAQAVLTAADDVIDALQATALAGTSAWLRSGLRERQAALGAALDGGNGVDAAVARVAAHALAGEGAAEVARLAGRLHRWLSADVPAPPTLAEAARQHARDDAYADFARTQLRFGGDETRLDASLRRLVGRADERRLAQDRAFAERLAEWTDRSETSAELLGVEDILAEVVAPLAAQRPVLVVVLDGMSHRVAVELVEDALQRGWTELRRGPQPDRALVLSALPSVTQFARASLLSGELRRALAAEEATAFAAHPRLVEASVGGPAPVLFHKGALRHAQGGLADAVREAVDGPGRVVGAVVNAIDDHLARSEQMRAHWSVRDVPPLSWLLTAAHDTGRLVVLVADHGHVIERGGQMRTRGTTGGERWAAADRAPQDGEILLAGPRVLAPEHRAVLCWDERVRFSPPKHGYHGGASPQEVLVPAVVLVPGLPDTLEGWAEAPYDPPSWWTGGAEPAEERPTETGPQLTLDTSAPRADAAWLRALTDSELLAEQRRRYPRPAVAEETLRAVLGALDAAGGTLLFPALARVAALAPQRLRGTLAAIGLLLNVEGYQALEVDDESGTVRLHRAILDEQFGL